jgi:hypothetical protein
MTIRWSHSAMGLLTLGVCILAPSVAHGIDGNAWIKQPENIRAVYLAGLFDGWTYLQSEDETYRKGHPKEPSGFIDNVLDFLKDCHRGKPTGQLIAIVEKYMKDHPDTWHYSMGSLVFVALGESCFIK